MVYFDIKINKYLKYEKYLKADEIGMKIEKSRKLFERKNKELELKTKICVLHFKKHKSEKRISEILKKSLYIVKKICKNIKNSKNPFVYLEKVEYRPNFGFLLNNAKLIRNYFRTGITGNYN